MAAAVAFRPLFVRVRFRRLRGIFPAKTALDVAPVLAAIPGMARASHPSAPPDTWNAFVMAGDIGDISVDGDADVGLPGSAAALFRARIVAANCASASRGETYGLSGRVRQYGGGVRGGEFPPQLPPPPPRVSPETFGGIPPRSGTHRVIVNCAWVCRALAVSAAVCCSLSFRSTCVVRFHPSESSDLSKSMFIVGFM